MASPVALSAYSRIELTWQQKMSAYWLLFWPAFGLSFIPILLLMRTENASELLWVSLCGQFVFLGVQGLFLPRLVRKDFRNFVITVTPNDGPQRRSLSRNEVLRIAVWICTPQLVIILLSLSLSYSIPAEHLRGISTLLLWFRILYVGPLSIQLALNARYPSFRLQAYQSPLI